MATSVRTGTVKRVAAAQAPGSLLATERAGPTAARDRALREIGRIKRTLHAPVAATIALWNTGYLGPALGAARRRGDLIPDALLAHFAPLGWQHLNLTGDYLWSADVSLAPDGFRFLQGMAISLPPSPASRPN